MECIRNKIIILSSLEPLINKFSESR